MNPIALVLLEAEITDDLISRTRRACVANDQLEPTEPAHFRVYLTALVADLREKSQCSQQFQRLQHYNECLIQLGVGLSEPSYHLPVRATTYMTTSA